MGIEALHPRGEHIIRYLCTCWGSAVAWTLLRGLGALWTLCKAAGCVALQILSRNAGSAQAHVLPALLRPVTQLHLRSVALGYDRLGR